MMRKGVYLAPVAAVAAGAVIYGGFHQHYDHGPSVADMNATGDRITHEAQPAAVSIGKDALAWYRRVGSHGYASALIHEGDAYTLYLRTSGFEEPLAEVAGTMGEEAYGLNVTMHKTDGELDPTTTSEVKVTGGMRSAMFNTRFDVGEGTINLARQSPIAGGNWLASGVLRQAGTLKFKTEIAIDTDPGKATIANGKLLAAQARYLAKRALKLPVDDPKACLIGNPDC